MKISIVSGTGPTTADPVRSPLPQSETPPKGDFTELEKRIARDIMLSTIMTYTTAGFLIQEIDHGVWLPVHEASSECFH